MEDKLKIGWFSFTCCEDSTILFTEILNDYFFKWKENVEFQHVKALKSNNKLVGLDVAFVEGAISSVSEARELRKIRKNCKKLVAIGSCACTGTPSNARNSLNKCDLTDYKNLINNFEYADKVSKLEDIVTVDDKIGGCPMRAEMFINKMEDYILEFKNHASN